MSFSFRNILIPVDLSINTVVAIDKALELAEEGATIHLFYVENLFEKGIKLFKAAIKATRDQDNQKKKVHRYKLSIKERLPGLNVISHVEKGSNIQLAIEQKATLLGADLVVIGKKSYHSWFPFLNTVLPNKLARRTGISVMTVKPGSLNNKIKTVVVPITGIDIRSKLEIIALICRKFNVRIYIATFLHNKDTAKDNGSGFLDLYRRISTYANCHVEYGLLYGDNKARAILEYAERINADIAVLTPDVETRIGWMNKNISDVLPPASKMQILAVR